MVSKSMPRTVWQAILWWQWYRFRLWVQGLSYQERDATQIPERDLHRIDVTWAVTALTTARERGSDINDCIPGCNYR